MEYISVPLGREEDSMQRILCCQCGSMIEPNPANMCVACLRTQVDITEGIPKQSTIYFCRSCESGGRVWWTEHNALVLQETEITSINELDITIDMEARALTEVTSTLRITLKEKQKEAIDAFLSGRDVFVSLPTGYGKYLQPPSGWVSCSLESRELLALCLKKLKGLGKVHLVDASFIWTEPHSKRLKIKLTIQKEVLAGTLLQQVFVVEFIVHHQMCEDCQRREAKDYWKAVVQVRQKTTHKKTFLYLEQLILKHNIHSNVLRIKEIKGGLDFYYAQKQDARKMVEFIMSVVPSKYKTSQELISHDVHSNTYNYKFTFSVEIVPVCRDNVVCLPRRVANALGNISPLVICSKVNSSLQVIDPTNLQVAEMSSDVYWRTPFTSLFDHRQLTQFLVLQIEVLPGQFVSRRSSRKHVLSEAWVAPLEELDRQMYCRTHLGHFINTGDVVLGVDFTRANLNNEHFDKLKPSEIPDLVLVKKAYGDRLRRHRKRKWELQSLPKEMEDKMEEGEEERDLLDFMEDLEEDETYRQDINIYMKPNDGVIPVEDGGLTGEEDEECYPQIGVEEMLQNLTISDPMSEQ